jgi:hypothetical protein
MRRAMEGRLGHPLSRLASAGHRHDSSPGTSGRAMQSRTGARRRDDRQGERRDPSPVAGTVLALGGDVSQTLAVGSGLIGSGRPG